MGCNSAGYRPIWALGRSALSVSQLVGCPSHDPSRKAVRLARTSSIANIEVVSVKSRSDSAHTIYASKWHTNAKMRSRIRSDHVLPQACPRRVEQEMSISRSRLSIGDRGLNCPCPYFSISMGPHLHIYIYPSPPTSFTASIDSPGIHISNCFPLTPTSQSALKVYS